MRRAFCLVAVGAWFALGACVDGGLAPSGAAGDRPSGAVAAPAGTVGTSAQAMRKAQDLADSLADARVVSREQHHDRTINLRDMTPVPSRVGATRTIPNRQLPNRVGAQDPAKQPFLPDSALQRLGPMAAAATVESGWAGIGNLNGVLPPDTEGDVGPNHYVQAVNLSIAVYTKTGTLLYGPVDANTLWQGFGGACETSNDGDPIVRYDQVNDRWMITQFALPGFPTPPFYQCIAVSQTGDPTGSWHRYSFTIPSEKMNDYPKLGFGRDGLYWTANQFTCDFWCQIGFGGLSWAGAGVGAFEWDAMIQGNGARFVYFDLESVNANFGGMLPADIDGPMPTTGPHYFFEWDDGSWIGPSDAIRVFEMNVNWSNPNSSTFNASSPQVLPTAPADPDLCGFSRNCIPQPGGTAVDALSDRLMHAAKVRYFGSTFRVVLNHSVDVGGDHAGLRWYELNKEGSGSWSIAQQGTYAPDGDNRWMGSIAMNGQGDIALGYSVSSASTFPSIRVTGRLDSDPQGQMTQTETTLKEGAGSQSHSSGRWGDYSSMSVDPSDDCTFWYTTEYYSSNSSAGWKTWIGSFKLADCGGGCQNDADCSDGNACNGAETCNIGTGQCEQGTPPNCNDNNPCTTDSCDPGTGCLNEAVPAGTVCRASAGICDVAEVCDGTGAQCPADGFKSAGTECRAANGVCDVAETCSGSSAACPADGFVAGGTECRGSAGVCDVAETCTGTSGACPVDGFVAAGTECRASEGVCDPAETCTGSSAACPADAKAAAGTPCRAANGACDVAEACDGSSNACPADAVASAGTECRAANGMCDVAEQCDGTSKTCPADGFVAAGTECRASAGVCDVAETCTGSSGACPPDGYVGNGTSCDDGNACTSGTTCQNGACGGGTIRSCDDQNPCTVDTCDSQGGCVHTPGNPGAICRASAGACDVAEVCDGITSACPANGFQSSSTVCRAAAGLCDVAETCTGSSADCPNDVLVAAGTECRAKNGTCDVAEACTGSSPTCPADAVEPTTTECRAKSGDCDVAEFCDGTTKDCPADAFEPPTVECRASAGVCDVAEFCTGAGRDCPSDAVEPSSTVCRASAGGCDRAEFCDGATVDCPANTFEPSTTECRAAVGTCDVAEFCSGTGATCPVDGFAPTTTSCDDNNVCTGTDRCDGSGGCSGAPEPAGTSCGSGLVCDGAGSCVTSGCDTYAGSLAGPNDFTVHDLGKINDKVLEGTLSCPNNPSVNFDLYLEVKRGKWRIVAQSVGGTCAETINYDVGASRNNGKEFRWVVSQNSGSGSYLLSSCQR